MENFRYGGFGDYIDGTVEIKILDAKKKSLKSSFEFFIDDQKQIIETNTDDFAIIYVKNGIHNLMVKKNSFQPLKIQNYVSFDDQITNITILLVKGNEIQEFKSPKWER